MSLQQADLAYHGSPTFRKGYEQAWREIFNLLINLSPETRAKVVQELKNAEVGRKFDQIVQEMV